MKIAVFDAHEFEKSLFAELNLKFKFDISYFEVSLTCKTCSIAEGFDVVGSFPNDKIDHEVLQALKGYGVKLIVLRSAGFNHVDMKEAAQAGIKVLRVPAYSPYAVAEFATTLILALNRKICRASTRAHDFNFSLEGLIGFDLHGKTVGVIGTGRIGSVMAKIMSGFGCKVLAFDPKPNQEIVDQFKVRYVPLEDIYANADIITLHVPLASATKHLINESAFAKMKMGVMIINTGRGALIDTKALIQALKTGKVGMAGLDVYEEEESLYSQDLSGIVLQDDVLARLLTFPNVLITAHQAFLTSEAIHNIVETTLQNVQDFEAGRPLINEVCLENLKPNNTI